VAHLRRPRGPRRRPPGRPAPPGRPGAVELAAPALEVRGTTAPPAPPGT
jgi:hypothetical protein